MGLLLEARGLLQRRKHGMALIDGLRECRELAVSELPPRSQIGSVQRLERLVQIVAMFNCQREPSAAKANRIVKRH
jgi:hypothetical protein